MEVKPGRMRGVRTTGIFITAAVLLSIFPGRLPGAAVAGVPREENQILYYNFDEREGNQVRDLSSAANHGTIIGDVKRVDGASGKALGFYGENYLEAENRYNGMTELTVSFWIWQPQKEDDQSSYILGNSMGGAIVRDPGFRFWKRFGGRARNIDFRISDGQEGKILNRDLLPTEEWVHVAGTLKDSTMRLFINGEMAVSTSGVEHTGNSRSAFRVGADGQGRMAAVPGMKIDELRLWDVALDDGEVRGLYLSGPAASD